MNCVLLLPDVKYGDSQSLVNCIIGLESYHTDQLEGLLQLLQIETEVQSLPGNNILERKIMTKISNKMSAVMLTWLKESFHRRWRRSECLQAGVRLKWRSCLVTTPAMEITTR